MPNENLSWWWNDKTTVDALGDWLTEKGLIQNAEQTWHYLRNPQEYNRHYDAWRQTQMQNIAVQRPPTSEFFDDRWYPINGEPTESITTIISVLPAPYLVKAIGEYGHVEMEYRKKVKGDRGSRVHDALQKNTVLRRELFDDEEWLLLMHAKLFQEQFEPKLILNEQWCWSTERHYAGRFDRIVLIDGRVTLIDWKTGYVGNSAWIQLAAEVTAIEETLAINIESWGIVQLNASVRAGWKFLRIEERNDVENETKILSDRYIESAQDDKAFTAAIQKAQREAIRNALARDMAIFDHAHAIWQYEFANVRPKRFPIFPVPEEMDLGIPILDERPEFREIMVPVMNETPKAPLPSVATEGITGAPVPIAADAPVASSATAAAPSPEAAQAAAPESPATEQDTEARILAELDQITSKETLVKWQQKNRDLIRVLPLDHISAIGRRVEEKLKQIQGTAPVVAPQAAPQTTGKGAGNEQQRETKPRRSKKG